MSGLSIIVDSPDATIEPVTLPELLASDTPEARILMFTFQADLGPFWDITSGKVHDIAQKLRFQLMGVRGKTSDTRLTNRVLIIKMKGTHHPIIFVAHSIGGLVCESVSILCFSASTKLTETQVLVGANFEGRSEKVFAKYIRRIAFLGTPFLPNEEQWAETGKLFYKLSGSTPGNDFEEWSRELVKLKDEFLELLNSREESAEPIEVASFFEGNPTELQGGENIMIVQESAAVIDPQCRRPTRLDSDHQGMCAFKDKDDTNYEKVCMRLRHWVGELAVPKDDELHGRTENRAIVNGTNEGFNIGQSSGTISMYNGGRTS
ncbi:unnamed protein product [Clonostachys rosea]|uniref:DUF676 domain-containing protein n=1 Tax=Bionectria ochroleuca TaxID=29856 RepID=A0ABY6UCW7_BIOOC|nr:unnamed protein product [Clonostachys rosea]